MEKKKIIELKEEMLMKISLYGCSAIHIFSEKASFTYSVGIEYTTGQPDVVMSGADGKVSQTIINNYCARCKDGEPFETGKRYDDFILGYDTVLKPVNRKIKAEFTLLYWFNGGTRNFKMNQIVCPDKSGNFPWETGYSKEYMKSQLLFF